jgi:hypothetical protein
MGSEVRCIRCGRAGLRRYLRRYWDGKLICADCAVELADRFDEQDSWPQEGRMDLLDGEDLRR